MLNSINPLAEGLTFAAIVASLPSVETATSRVVFFKTASFLITVNEAVVVALLKLSSPRYATLAT